MKYILSIMAATLLLVACASTTKPGTVGQVVKSDLQFQPIAMAK